jgi:hypothetical protein
MDSGSECNGFSATSIITQFHFTAKAINQYIECDENDAPLHPLFGFEAGLTGECNVSRGLR